MTGCGKLASYVVLSVAGRVDQQYPSIAVRDSAFLYSSIFGISVAIQLVARASVTELLLPCGLTLSVI